MLIRSVICGNCGIKEEEKEPGEGWPGWIQILGLTNPEELLLNDPHFCKKCKDKYILPFLNQLTRS